MSGRCEHLRDDALLARTDADPVAFGVFYRRHVGPVMAFLLRRTSDMEIAFDVCAEVFASALERSSAFRAPEHGSAAPWLYGIARHKLADLHRRGLVDDAVRQRLAMQPIVVDDEGIAELEALIASFVEAPVLQALESLPDDEREAIRGRVMDERGYEDIARQFGVSESVVRKRVSRGLARLRTSIGSRHE